MRPDESLAARPILLVGGFKHERNSFAQGTMSREYIARIPRSMWPLDPELEEPWPAGEQPTRTGDAA